MPILEIRDLAKSFGGVVALNGVNVAVEEGQILGVIGPNGSGKTTLLNLVTGIFPPSGGDIRFAGESIVGLKAHQIARRSIGRTFQNIRLFDQLSVLENVLIGLDHHLKLDYWGTVFGFPRVRREEARGREEAAKILRSVRGALSHSWDRVASELPYADKRRVEIARALGIRPRLLLLDEPAAGMAPSEMTALIDDLKHLNAAGLTILLIEHKMRVIEGVTDHVVVLDYGEKIAEGPFDAVRSDPRVIEAYLGASYANAAGAGGR